MTDQETIQAPRAELATKDAQIKAVGQELERVQAERDALAGKLGAIESWARELNQAREDGQKAAWEALLRKVEEL